MRVILAPMDGVIDGCMRDILTRSGAFDLCMTEFLRVTAQRNPLKLFKRICPEIDNGWRTPSGTPVVLQLLGSIPEAMASNAEIAVKLGVPGIDINFGCPSKSVTRKGCGAILLNEPHHLYDIVKAVRGVVPEGVTLSAKMRLGYESTKLALENAAAIEEAGADFVTVHARTRADAYSVPARWEWLARINEAITIPVVANGDINSVEAYNHCINISGCTDVMIGRGAVSSPGLAGEIKASLAGKMPERLPWDEIHSMITTMAEARMGAYDDGHIGTRVKLWLVYLKKEYSEAELCFKQVCRINKYSAMSPLPL